MGALCSKCAGRNKSTLPRDDIEVMGSAVSKRATKSKAQVQPTAKATESPQTQQVAQSQVKSQEQQPKSQVQPIQVKPNSKPQTPPAQDAPAPPIRREQAQIATDYEMEDSSNFESYVSGITPKFTQGRSFSNTGKTGMTVPTALTLTKDGLIQVGEKVIPEWGRQLVSQIIKLYNICEDALYNQEHLQYLLCRTIKLQDVMFTHPQTMELHNLLYLESVVDNVLTYAVEFNQRGWLTRLLKSNEDYETFLVLDRLLLNTILEGDVDVSDDVINDTVKTIKEYPADTDSKTMIDKISTIGGLESLRSDYQTAYEFLPRQTQKKKMEILDDKVQIELDMYDDKLDIGAYSLIENFVVRQFWRKNFPKEYNVEWNQFFFKLGNASQIQCYLKSEDDLNFVEEREFKNNLISLMSTDVDEGINLQMINKYFPRSSDLYSQLQKLQEIAKARQTTQVVRNIQILRQSDYQMFTEVNDGLLYGYPEVDVDVDAGVFGPQLDNIRMNLSDKSLRVFHIKGAEGVGKKTLANVATRMAVSFNFSQESFWVSLRGISYFPFAVKHLMQVMGITSVDSNAQDIVTYLEDRPKTNFIFTFVDTEELLQNMEQQEKFLVFIDDMINNIYNVRVFIASENNVQQQFGPSCTVHELEAQNRERSLRLIGNVLNLEADENEIIADFCQDNPLMIQMISRLIYYGDIQADYLPKFYKDPTLPDVPNGAMTEKPRTCLTTIILAMEPKLTTALLVMSYYGQRFLEQYYFDTLFESDTLQMKRFLVGQLARRRVVVYDKQSDSYMLPQMLKRHCQSFCKIMNIQFDQLKFTCIKENFEVMNVAYKIFKNKSDKVGLHMIDKDITLLDVADKLQDENNSSILTVAYNLINEMMDLMEMRGNPNSNEKFLTFLKNHFQKNDNLPMQAQVSLTLGQMFIDQNRPKQAVHVLHEALVIIKKIVDGDGSEIKKRDIESVKTYKSLAVCYISLAKCYQAQGLPNEAIENGKKALTTTGNLFGKDSLEYGEMVYSVGDIFKQQKSQKEMDSFQESLNCYKKALQKQEQEFGQYHKSVAETLRYMANIQRKLDMYQQAEKNFKRCLQIQKRVLGNNNLNIANTYTQLGDFYFNELRLDESVENYKLCLRSKEKFYYNNQGQDIALTLMTLAEVLQEKSNFQEALRYIKRSGNIIQKTLSGDHPLLGTSKIILSNNLRLSGDIEQAEREILTSQKILVNKYQNENHPTLGACYAALCEVKIILRKSDRLEALAHQSVEIRRKSFGDNHQKTASSLQTLASSLMYFSKYDEAKKHISECLKIRRSERQDLQDKDPRLARSLIVLAQIFMRQNLYNQALSELNYAIKIFRDNTNEKSLELYYTLGLQGIILQKEQRTQQLGEKQFQDAIQNIQNYKSNHYLISILNYYDN